VTAGLDLGVEVEKERGGLGQKEIGKGNWGLRGLLSPHPFLLYLLFFLLFSFSYHSFAFVPIDCEGCLPFRFVLLLTGAVLLFTTPAVAFGEGNIVSVSQVAGKYWRHGGIWGRSWSCS